MDNKSKFNKSEYDNQYAKNNYDRLNIQIPKGQKQYIQDVAKSQGKSLNKFITDLIYNALPELDHKM